MGRGDSRIGVRATWATGESAPRQGPREQPSTLQDRPIDTLGANFGVVVPESSAARQQQGLPELTEANIANRMTCKFIALPTQLRKTNCERRVRAVLRRVTSSRRLV